MMVVQAPKMMMTRQCVTPTMTILTMPHLASNQDDHDDAAAWAVCLPILVCNSSACCVASLTSLYTLIKVQMVPPGHACDDGSHKIATAQSELEGCSRSQARRSYQSSQEDDRRLDQDGGDPGFSRGSGDGSDGDGV